MPRSGPTRLNHCSSCKEAAGEEGGEEAAAAACLVCSRARRSGIPQMCKQAAGTPVMHTKQL